LKKLQKYLSYPTDAAPLAVFRIFFGLLIFLSIVRFHYYDWIEKLYLEPSYFFSYYGFEWVKPLGQWTYLLFGICALSAIMVMLGWKYRLSIITLFLSFTYIELMDKTNYLNHYYFISSMCFLMIFLPANAYFSIDAYRSKNKRFQNIPQWTIFSIQFLLCIVYFYAGLAKLNSDWLVEAQPLKIWLTAKYNTPFIGDLLQENWVHHAFSYGGAAYDLLIPFFLLYPKTRNLAFLAVVLFHWLTWVLFPIGMFPIIMIFSGLIFLDGRVHRWIIRGLTLPSLKGSHSLFTNQSSKIALSNSPLGTRSKHEHKTWRLKSTFWKKAIPATLSIFFLIQMVFPFRHLAYPDELFWTEEGYRFSWRVMLMEKAGYANFKIVNPETGKNFYVQNGNFLTPLQEKQMATQPDFILEFAHYLERHYQNWNNIKDPQIYVESYVALNGRRSRPFIDPTVDLTEIKPSFRHKDWILPFEDEIWGF